MRRRRKVDILMLGGGEVGRMRKMVVDALLVGSEKGKKRV